MTHRFQLVAFGSSLLIITIPLLHSVVGFARNRESAPFLAPAKRGTTCILDSRIMGQTHMTYLKQLRDDVVRNNKRMQQFSKNSQFFRTCSGCHADKIQFCDRCHERAGVNLDCFGCHNY